MRTRKNNDESTEKLPDVQKVAEENKRRMWFVITWVVGGTIVITAMCLMGILVIDATQSSAASAAEAAETAKETKKLAEENVKLLEENKALSQERINNSEEIKNLLVQIAPVIEAANLLNDPNAKALSDAALKEKLTVVLLQADCNTQNTLNEAFVTIGLAQPGELPTCDPATVPDIPG